eukprot:GCRY01002305.1.p1 GENE.GCRY01002305.1~~GCRY01002305.1.p1  ORF type:complete len:178 (+),score=35.53 GCRY01002305.1:149-682(+)
MEFSSSAADEKVSRRGGVNRMEYEKRQKQNSHGGKGEASPLFVDKQSDSFCQDKERFNQNYASFDQTQRQEMREKKDAFYQKKRENFATVEKSRKQSSLQKQEEREKYFEQKRASCHHRNQSGATYNPLTFASTTDPRASAALSNEANAMKRAEERAVRLRAHQCSYNPITGEDYSR